MKVEVETSHRASTAAMPGAPRSWERPGRLFPWSPWREGTISTVSCRVCGNSLQQPLDANTGCSGRKLLSSRNNSKPSDFPFLSILGPPARTMQQWYSPTPLSADRCRVAGRRPHSACSPQMCLLKPSQWREVQATLLGIKWEVYLQDLIKPPASLKLEMEAGRV